MSEREAENGSPATASGHASTPVDPDAGTATTLGGSPSDDYSRLGEHVASVLEAAERAAERVTREARNEAATLLEQSRREAAERIGEAHREAEATRIAAQQEVAEREGAMRERGRILQENLTRTEQRLKQLTTGLRELASRLDELTSSNEGQETLEESLRPSIDDRVAEQESPDVAR